MARRVLRLPPVRGEPSFILHPSSFILALLVAAALCGGCSLMLNTDLEGLACDSKDACLDGYFCDSAKTCRKVPACAADQVWAGDHCARSCTNVGCAAGYGCKDGECVAVVFPQSLGSPCRSSSDCRDAGAFCLLPYGGFTDGVCTKTCSGDADCDPAAHPIAPACRRFSAARGDAIALCVNEAFRRCSREDECGAWGLSCGLYATTPANAVLACRSRVAGGVAIGEEKDCAGSPGCVNGLCVPQESSNRCTMPCGVPADCDAAMPGSTCLAVALNPDASGGLPAVYPSLCVPRGASAGNTCTGQKDCHADAPDCVQFVEAGPRLCAARCLHDQDCSAREATCVTPWDTMRAHCKNP